MSKNVIHGFYHYRHDILEKEKRMFTRREFFKASAIVWVLNPLALIEQMEVPDAEEGDMPEIKMDQRFLTSFIEEGLRKWKEVQNSFSADQAMRSFLAKAVPVVCFDHMQLDMESVKELYKPIKADPDNKGKEQESRRLKRVGYYETIMQEISLEVRFPVMNMDSIDRLKRHPLIRAMNSTGTSSIAVVIHSYRRNQGGGHGKKA